MIPGYSGTSCSVDRVTGNLAVTNRSHQTSAAGNVVVYANAKGSPTTYSDPEMFDYGSCAYDDAGNLFVAGATQQRYSLLAELPKGGSTFTNITVDKGFYSNNLQWDGEYLALQAGFSNEIYRVAVSRSSGTVVQTISLCDLGRIGMVKSRCNGFRGAVALSGVGFREAYAPLRATRQGNAGRRSY